MSELFLMQRKDRSRGTSAGFGG